MVKMLDDLKEISKDPNAFAFLIYKGIEGALSGLEEYRISKKIVYSNKFFEKNFEDMIKGYLEDLPFLERTMIKTFLSLPWPDTVKFLSDMFLDFGKKGDGSYKNTMEVLKGSLKKISWK